MATRKHSAAKPSLPAHPAGRAAGSRPRSVGIWLALAVVALVGGALALTLIRSAGGGQLSAAVQSYNFGSVPIHGGVVSTQFPLTVAGDTLVTELTTS